VLAKSIYNIWKTVHSQARYRVESERFFCTRQIFAGMKWTGSFMLTFLVLLSLSGRCQMLNFSGKDIPLIDIFKIIKCQAGVLFFYDAALLQNTKRVSIEWNNVSLEKALNDVFKGQPLTWVLEDKIVTIIKRAPATDVKKPARSNAFALLVLQDLVAD